MENRPGPKEKILAALRKAEYDLSGPEICERTGLHRNTVYKWIEVLKAEKRIEVTRKVGKTEFFRPK